MTAVKLVRPLLAISAGFCLLFSHVAAAQTPAEDSDA